MAKAKKAKKEKLVEPYFQDMVEIWFSFCREKFHEDPTFAGSAPRDLKDIVKTLHERAIKSNVEWTQNIAEFRFRNFLDFAYQDSWLSKNWLLSNINRQKDKIFFNIRAAIMRQPVDPFE